MPALSTRPLPIAGPHALDAGMLTREENHTLLDVVSAPKPSAPKPSAPTPSPDSGRFDCAGLVFFICAVTLTDLQRPVRRTVSRASAKVAAVARGAVRVLAHEARREAACVVARRKSRSRAGMCDVTPVVSTPSQVGGWACVRVPLFLARRLRPSVQPRAPAPWPALPHIFESIARPIEYRVSYM